MWKKVLYAVVGLIALYYIVLLATRREKLQENKVLLNKIDSLNQVSRQLQENQIKLLERDSTFNESINNIDYKIDNVKEKKVIIEKHFHDKSQAVSKHTPTQIDSFFKDRYDY